MYTISDMPVEIQRVMMKEIVPMVEQALVHLDELDIGQARRCLRSTLDNYLPFDNGEHYVWPRAEEATR